MQKVLTGSARANEAQIAALQATVPGLETNSALARQKLAAFTQNVDLLRQGLPRMPGIDVIPVRPWNGKQGGQAHRARDDPSFLHGQIEFAVVLRNRRQGDVRFHHLEKHSRK